MQDFIQFSIAFLRFSASSLVICCVSVQGRLLIIDNVQNAERNILPIINNLLENREMQLDSGMFLCSPERFDLLLETNTPEELAARGLLRTHPDFRVIAIGLPVPAFPGLKRHANVARLYLLRYEQISISIASTTSFPAK